MERAWQTAAQKIDEQTFPHIIYSSFAFKLISIVVRSLMDRLLDTITEFSDFFEKKIQYLLC